MKPNFISSMLFLLFGPSLTVAPVTAKNAASIQPDTVPLGIDSFPAPAPVFIGLAPAMINHKQTEILLFNVFETQQVDVIRPQDNAKDRIRSTVLLHALQITYGITKSKRFNLGFDLQYLHQRADNDENSSPLKVLGSDTETGRSYHTFSKAGPRVRVMPLGSLPELTLQSAVLFPVADRATQETIPDIARLQWLLQISYYQQFGSWFYLFGGVSGAIDFPKNNINELTTYSLPLNLYAVGNVIRRKLYLFGSLNYFADFEKPKNLGFKRRDFRFSYGIGLQYYFSPRFLLNLEYQRPFSNEIASSQIEEVPGSLYGLNLGLRYLAGRWVD